MRRKEYTLINKKAKKGGPERVKRELEIRKALTKAFCTVKNKTFCSQ